MQEKLNEKGGHEFERARSTTVRIWSEERVEVNGMFTLSSQK